MRNQICRALLAVAIVAAEAQAQAPSLAAGLPEARAIIARYVDALGGREALLARRSARTSATVEIPAQGVSGKLEVFAAMPERVAVRLELPGLGVVQSGYDGKVGWSIHPALGPRLVEGDELKGLIEMARFHGELHEEPGTAMTTVGEELFEGRTAWKVRVLGADSAERYEYFDRETGLLAGSTQKHKSPRGEMEVTSLSAEYRKFGNILVATKETQRSPMGSQTVTTVTLEYNVVPDSAFVLPPAIRALVERRTGVGVTNK